MLHLARDNLESSRWPERKAKLVLLTMARRPQNRPIDMPECVATLVATETVAVTSKGTQLKAKRRRLKETRHQSLRHL